MSRFTPLLLVASLLTGADAPQLVLPARIISVHDGDTLTAEVTLRMNVRLLSCWAPEITGDEKPDGLKSKKRLEELALHKSGVLSIPLYDDIGKSFSFSRVLGNISVDGKDVGEILVSEGYATKSKTGEP